MTKKSLSILSLWLLMSSCQTPGLGSSDLKSWKKEEQKKSIASLLKAISPDGTKSGVVIASPSTVEPNYFYHWQRDGALTMNVVADLYEHSPVGNEKSLYDAKLQDYIAFSRQLQKTKNPSGGFKDFYRGYGEPKFNVDGSPFTGEWGRPQNDGPALQTLTLVHYLKAARSAGNKNLLGEIYDRDATKSIFKSNLEFLVHQWRDTCFDLWEEVRGHHFYTQLVQRRALLEGADVAEWAHDKSAAQRYRKHARLIQAEIEKHFSSSKKYILTTLDRSGGIGSKTSNLDASVILAALHARGSLPSSLKDPYFSATDDRILATSVEIEKTFAHLYKINDPQNFPAAKGLGVAIGRYPEDIYDGIATSRGNPWILLTAAMAEHLYQVAKDIENQGWVKITPLNLEFYDRAFAPNAVKVGETLLAKDVRFQKITEGLRQHADDYLRRVRHHAAPDGGFAEEIQRDTGLPRGARDLTWNYASLITAISAE